MRSPRDAQDPTPADVTPAGDGGSATDAVAPRVLLLTSAADRDVAVSALTAAAAVDGWTIRRIDTPEPRGDRRYLLPPTATVVVEPGVRPHPDARQVLRRARAADAEGLRGVVIDGAEHPH